jgi:hypothetical protein
MRKLLSMAAAAVILGAVPAGAQMRRASMPPMRSAHRTITYALPRPVRPPVRAVYIHPAPGAPLSPRPVIDPNPAIPAAAPTSPASSSSFLSPGGTPISLQQLLNSTPGLGFDYTHLAAVNSGLAVRAFIDPVTQHELAIAQQLPQEQPVGFLPTYYAPAAEGYAAPQPTVIVVQQPAPLPIPARAPAAAPAPRVAAPAAPPLPVGKLYLVRRNGKTIQVIAFSQQDERIVYITTDGMRLSMSMDQLDIKATEQKNAERGTILHLTE